MITHDTYEHVCAVNRYLFDQLEQCTVMIEHLEKCGLDITELKLKKARLKFQINTNLDKLEIALDIRDL